MKKIKKFVSVDERKRKVKQNQIIIGLILVFIMILSVIGFALQGVPQNQNNTNKRITYNGFDFFNSNGLWIMGNFGFTYNPEEVPNIGGKLKDITYYQEVPLYIYSESRDAEIEAIMNLGQIVQRVQNACPIEKGIECEGNVPFKDCKDNFIIIKINNERLIYQEENCIYIEGPEEDIIKLVDQFLFKILTIRE